MNKEPRRILIALALCLLAAAFLAGCSILSAPEPLQIVVLNRYKAAAPLCEKPLPVQILLSSPYASAGLSTDRIAILMDDRQVTYLEGYKWDDANPNLVQRALMDAINDSGCFKGAGTGSMALRADYRLEVDVKLMHFVDVNGQKQPAAEVSLLLRLIEVNSGSMLGQHNAYAHERAANGDLFKSMESAMHSAVQSSVDWLRASLKTHLSEK